METFRDVRHALRLFHATPITSIVIVLTLAFSIGVNTALFSVIDAVWLKAVPYPEASRLVRVHMRNDQFPRMAVSWADAGEWRAQEDIFEGLAVLQPGTVRVGTQPDGNRAGSPLVEPHLFRFLGESAIAGRVLFDSDAAPDSERVAVVTDRYWRKELAAAASAVGRSITLNGQPVTIVGVVPDRVQSILKGDIIRPLRRPATVTRGARGLLTIAELRGDVSLASAQARLNEVSARAATLYPADNAAWSAHVEPLRDALVGADVGRTLTLLGAVVALVLIGGCASVASLLVARTTLRTGEMAVRTALGATRLRLTRQLLTESLLLTAFASVAALLMVMLTRDALVALMPPGIPHVDDIRIDLRVLAFAFVATIVTALLAGSLPALKLSKLDRLRTGERGHTLRAHRLTDVLLATQSAIAIVVLIVAGLIVGSFIRLLQVDAGFSPRDVVLFSLSAPSAGATTSAADDGAVLDELRRLPYVSAAGAVDQTPLSGNRVTYSFEVEGRVPPASQPQIDLRRATPGYFEAMAIPLKQGRTFATSDAQGAPLVAIVNDRAARTIWPGESPVGRQIRAGGSAPLTVVGVVGDVRHLGLDRDPQPELYRAWAQEPMGSLSFVARVDQNPQQLIASLVAQGRTWAGGRQVRTATTFSDQVAGSVRAPRFRMWLCALLGALVLGITVVGVAGVSAQAVAGRTRELGIRLAIGRDRVSSSR